jgi:dolichyl-phosphate-mannose-protein mannosyltransferase
VSTVTAMRTRAVAVPAGVWLAAIVIVSTGLWIAVGRANAAPWIMIDEIVYSELAKSFAAHGHFLVRGVPSTGYGFVYPVVIAPAWWLFAAIPDAYRAAKVIDSVVMSLTAIPAYFLARRLLPSGLSLAAAALAVLVPSMLYTGMLMTENAFYPLFVLAAFLFVQMLEAPTWRRQIALLAVCFVAFETRAQAVALIPAIVTAPVLLALIERRPLRNGLRPFAALYAILGGGALLAVLGTVAMGRSPLSLLGAYRAATTSSYTVGGFLHYLLYHVAEFSLYVGVIPFAALLALWLAPRSSTPAGRAFAVASLTISVFLTVEVALFASQTSVDRIEERNLFYLAPFALIALLGLGVDGLITRRRGVLVAAAAVAGVLPFFIPFTKTITTSAVSDTFAMLPWWWVQDHLVSLGDVKWAALAVCLVAASLLVLLPRRFALVLPALVAGYFLLTAYVVEYGVHGIEKTSLGSSWAGTHLSRPDWIDRLVGRNAKVSVLWTDSMPTAYPVWENEFFNRSVGKVYDVDGALRRDPLPETDANRASNGDLVVGDKPVTAQYVLANSAVELGGKRIKQDPLGVDLYRVNGPIVILSHVGGLYRNDTWSGKKATYQRVECTGGSLTVTLQGDDRLFTRPQTVVATEGGQVVGRATIPVSKETTLKVPLMPSEDHRCVVVFTAGRTLVPARVQPASTDLRPLGAHFLKWNYNSPR